MAESAHAATSTATAKNANEVYALGSSDAESDRLLRQADELAGHNAALLDRAGLRPGQSAIDLGCGPRGILELLADRVSPGGRVVGVDADPAHATMAAELAAARGLTGVEIINADARHTGLPSGSFDVVHARALLINVPEPAEVVAEMMRLAKPGGWVISMEPDDDFLMSYPPHPAYDRFAAIFHAAAARNGADPKIGRRVPELLREAGLVDIEVEARPDMSPPGHPRRTLTLDLVRAMRPQVLAMGLATEAEFDELDAAARAHVEDLRTIVVSGLLFLVSARKPDRPPATLADSTPAPREPSPPQ
jgi:ubiquinone/menaquinone biosynthesis C-methylase UbiE